MARVKCITMQRDEDILLEAWIRYHGYLFGFENLLVFDNNSTHSEVIATLRFYERLGVDVRWEHRTGADFVGRGGHFRNIVRHWDATADYDFALPLNCDEFLCVFTRDGISCRRSLIDSHFEALRGSEAPLAIDIGLDNVPQRPGWFSARHRPKRFLAARTVAEIDHEHREIRTDRSDAPRSTNFARLHVHNKPIEALKRSARAKLDAFLDVDDPEARAAYAGPYAACLAELGLTEKDYLRGFDEKLLCAVPEFSLTLEALGITHEALVDENAEPAGATTALRLPKRKPREAERVVTFDARAYQDIHPDIAHSGALALKHYLVFGHQEGREI